MVDTWNQPQPGKERRGMPTWSKVLFGCGIAAVLLIAACIGGGVYFFKKQMPAISRKIAEGPYKDLRASMVAAESSEGLMAFYRQYPALTKRYATEAAFQAAFQDAPRRLGAFPEHLGDVFNLLREQRLSIQPSQDPGGHRVIVKFRNPGKPYLVGEWEDKKLVDLYIE